MANCPKCQGRMGFDHYRHVPYRNVGGLCFLCGGKGAVSDDVAARHAHQAEVSAEKLAAHQAAQEAEQKRAEEATHAAAWDRHGDTYRLAYALTRFHPHTDEQHSCWMLASNAVNGLRDRRFEGPALQRAAHQLPAAVRAFGLVDLGLEEIEWLAAEGEPLPVKDPAWWEA